MDRVPLTGSIEMSAHVSGMFAVIDLFLTGHVTATLMAEVPLVLDVVMS